MAEVQPEATAAAAAAAATVADDNIVLDTLVNVLPIFNEKDCVASKVLEIKSEATQVSITPITKGKEQGPKMYSDIVRQWNTYPEFEQKDRLRAETDNPGVNQIINQIYNEPMTSRIRRKLQAGS